MKPSTSFAIAAVLTVVAASCATEPQPDGGVKPDGGVQPDGGLLPDGGFVTVTGTITGSKVSGISVALVGGSLVPVATSVTGADGKYTFTKVYDGAYRIIPRSAGALFTPGYADIDVKGASLTGKNFVAESDPLPCSDDAGTWCRPTIAGTNAINRIWGSSGKDLWFVGDNGTVLRYSSAASGQPLAWASVDAGTVSNLYAIWGYNSGDVWLAGESKYHPWLQRYYNAVHYVKGGASEWSPKQITLNSYMYEINAVWSSAPGDRVVYAGCGSNVGSYDPSNDQSTQGVLPSNANIYGLWVANSSDMWAVGRTYLARGAPAAKAGPEGGGPANGRMFRNVNDGGWKDASDAGLKLWSAQLEAAVGAGAWLSDVQGTGANDVWAVGTNGLVAHFDGGVWDIVDAGAGQANLYGVWPVSASEVWVAGGVPPTGTSGWQPKLFRYTSVAGKGTWEPITPPADAGVFYRVWADSATNAVWLVGPGGVLRYRP